MFVRPVRFAALKGELEPAAAPGLCLCFSSGDWGGERVGSRRAAAPPPPLLLLLLLAVLLLLAPPIVAAPLLPTVLPPMALLLPLKSNLGAGPPSV